MVFTGTYQRSLDSKLRVLLPKRLRQSLEKSAELFLTPGTDDCLELHTDQSLNDLAIQARDTKSGSQNLRTFSRLFYARACHCEIDKQGRIRIPQTLSELAHLTKDIVFVGVGFHWEVWNAEDWNRFLSNNNAQFDQITTQTFDVVPTDDGQTPEPKSISPGQPR